MRERSTAKFDAKPVTGFASVTSLEVATVVSIAVWIARTCWKVHSLSHCSPA